MRIVGIALLGALGALARNAVDGWVANRTGGGFPWGTLVVNASGSLLLGFVFALLTERASLDPTIRFAIMTGFLGAYTTFSTFSLETVRLMQGGEFVAAAGNVALSVVLGLLGIYVGMMGSRGLP